MALRQISSTLWSDSVTTIPLSSMLLFGRDEARQSAVPECAINPSDTSDMGLRISSIFVVFVGSALGALLPVWLSRRSKLSVPQLCFFVAKYLGTGVIMATAFMHLLSPASESLRSECLKDILGGYDWAMVICLITIMVMFLLEITLSSFDIGFGLSHGNDDGHGHGHGHGRLLPPRPVMEDSGAAMRSVNVSRLQELGAAGSGIKIASSVTGSPSATSPDGSSPTMAESVEGGMCGKHHIPVPLNEINGEDHLSHQRSHVQGDEHPNYATQMTAIFILEFGVIFHSIFIGLALAVANNFVVLYIVLVFHQTFEGLGLGARLATAVWPSGYRRWTPYGLGLLYAVSTPLAIAVGLVTSKSIAMKGSTSLIVNGVFDAIGGGILMYTGLVELLAHEFMFNPEMRKSGLAMQLFAFGCVGMGAALMAILAMWA